MVLGTVDALLFLGEVIGPVGVEVAVSGEGAESEDGFGTVEAPTGAGDVHAIFDQVAACAFDDAGGDRPALLQGVGVAEVGALVGEVAGAGISGFALVKAEA